MINKQINHRHLVFRVNLLFNIDYAAWKPYAKEYVGEGLRLLRTSYAMEEAHSYLTVVNYRTKLPCDYEHIQAIMYNGYRLPISTMVNMTDDADIADRVKYHPVENYSELDGRYIHTSFEEGSITVYYKRYPEDSQGNPLVPDLEPVLEYLSWFILMRLVGRGYKHPIHSNYDKLEYKVMGQDNIFSLRVKASNALRKLTIDQRHNISTILKPIIPNNEMWDNEMFDNTGAIETNTDED